MKFLHIWTYSGCNFGHCKAIRKCVTDFRHLPLFCCIWQPESCTISQIGSIQSLLRFWMKYKRMPVCSHLFIPRNKCNHKYLESSRMNKLDALTSTNLGTPLCLAIRPKSRETLIRGLKWQGYRESHPHRRILRQPAVYPNPEESYLWRHLDLSLAGNSYVFPWNTITAVTIEIKASPVRREASLSIVIPGPPSSVSPHVRIGKVLQSERLESLEYSVLLARTRPPVW